jgi:hypothetical protein
MQPVTGAAANATAPALLSAAAKQVHFELGFRPWAIPDGLQATWRASTCRRRIVHHTSGDARHITPMCPRFWVAYYVITCRVLCQLSRLKQLPALRVRAFDFSFLSNSQLHKLPLRSAALHAY